MHIFVPKLLENHQFSSISSSKDFVAVSAETNVYILSKDFFYPKSSEKRIIQSLNGHKTTHLSFDSPVSCIRFTYDGSCLAVATEAGTFLYHSEKWDKAFQVLSGPAYEVCWSQQGHILATSWKQISIYVKDEGLRTETIVKKTEHADSNHQPAVSIEESKEAVESTSQSSEISFKLIKVIEGHHTFVGGLAFDPMGQFLASQSFDHTLKVWKLSTFGVEKSIAKPFEQMPTGNRFLRLSWSPDGAHIASVNAVNEGAYVIAIVQRDTWTYDINLVGHQGPLECATFNPYLYEDPFQKSIIASAAHDGCVSIWNTACARPMAVIHELSCSSFVDLQWSTSGFELYGVSLDGNLMLLQFEESEFGEKMDTIHYPDDLSYFNSSRSKAHVNKNAAADRTTSPTQGQPESPSKSILLRPPPSIASSPESKRRKCPKKFVARPPVPHPTSLYSQIRIGCPYLKPKLVISKSFGTLIVKNHNQLSLLKCTFSNLDGNDCSWFSYLPNAIVLANGTSVFWAVATEDSSIYIYSPAGRLLLPPVVVAATPCFLECCGDFLCCIVSTGLLYIWNIKNFEAIHSPVSTLPLFHSNFSVSKIARGPSIEQFFVTKQGHPVAIMSDGNAFAFIRDSSSWLRVSEGWWMIGSQYWGPLASESNEESPLGFLERCTDEEIIKAGRGRFLQRLVKALMLRQGYDNYEMLVSIRHLENRLMSSAKLDLEYDFRENLILYAKKIAEEGMKDKMDELCKELLGPLRIPHNGIDTVKVGNRLWSPTIAGNNKRNLLKDIIIHTAKYRDMQRITSQYSDLLRRSALL